MKNAVNVSWFVLKANMVFEATNFAVLGDLLSMGKRNFLTSPVLNEI